MMGSDAAAFPPSSYAAAAPAHPKTRLELEELVDSLSSEVRFAREKEKERQRRRRFSGPLETTAEGSSRRRVCPHSFGVLLFFLATPPLNRGSLSPLFCSSVTMDDVGTLASACLRVAGRNRFQLEE